MPIRFWENPKSIYEIQGCEFLFAKPTPLAEVADILSGVRKDMVKVSAAMPDSYMFYPAPITCPMERSLEVPADEMVKAVGLVFRFQRLQKIESDRQIVKFEGLLATDTKGNMANAYAWQAANVTDTRDMLLVIDRFDNEMMNAFPTAKVQRPPRAVITHPCVNHYLVTDLQGNRLPITGLVRTQTPKWKPGLTYAQRIGPGCFAPRV